MHPFGSQLLAGIIRTSCLTAILISAGCKEQSASTQTTAPASQPGSRELRIISLSPAISRTLVDFKLADRLVGRTPHCKSIDQVIPVVGDLLTADYEAIIRLNPTHILVQPPAAGIDQHLVELAANRRWTLGQWRLNNRDDIEQMVTELPAVLCGDNGDCEELLSRRSAEIINFVADALAPGRVPLFRGRVLVVHSVEPSVFVSGAGTYHDDILRTLGASNASTAKGWANLTLEDVLRINPDAVILVNPGAPTQGAELAALGPLQALPIAAVKHGRIAIATSADGELPSTGVINVAREFRDILQRFALKPAPPEDQP